jgi:hypothetical protein
MAFLPDMCMALCRITTAGYGSLGPSLLCITCMAKRDHQYGRDNPFAWLTIETRMNLKKTTSSVDRSAYVATQIYPKDLKSPWQSHGTVRRQGVGSFELRRRCATWPQGRAKLCQKLWLMAL